VFGVMCSVGPLLEPAHVITFAHCEGHTADLSSTFVVTVSEAGSFPSSDVGTPVINVVLYFSFTRSQSARALWGQTGTDQSRLICFSVLTGFSSLQPAVLVFLAHGERHTAFLCSAFVVAVT